MTCLVMRQCLFSDGMQITKRREDVEDIALHSASAFGKSIQSRYRAVPFLDEATLLACAAYLDLNLEEMLTAEKTCRGLESDESLRNRFSLERRRRGLFVS